jgi:WD40 repeat protein
MTRQRKTHVIVFKACKLLFAFGLFTTLLSSSSLVATARDNDTHNFAAITLNVDRQWSVANAHSAGITSVTFVPNTTGLLTAAFGLDGIRYWEFGADRPKFEFDQHDGDITGIAVSADGQRILSGSIDMAVNLWSGNLGNESPPELRQQMFGHTNWILSVALSWDGSKALSGSADSTAILWSTATGEPIYTFTGYVRGILSVAISADGTKGASGSCGIYVSNDSSTDSLSCVEGAAYILDLVTHERILSLNGHNDMVYSIAFSADDSKVITGSADNTAILWNAATGAIIQRFPSEACLQAPVCDMHINDVFSTSLSRDGSLLLTGSADGTAIIWDVQTGASIRKIDFNAAVRSVTFNQNGDHFAVGTYGREFSVWAIQSLE